MKFIKLLTSAYVNGALRHPHEGVLHVENEEAQRLFDNEAAEDVTSDFSAKENKESPVQSITITSGSEADQPDAVQHQSEIAPVADAPKKEKAK